MAAFTSPLADLPTWTLSSPGLRTVPAGLRYAGEQLLALRAVAPVATQVRMPALGILRSAVPAAGPEAGRLFIEVQVNPFPVRRVMQAVVFGLPTFYLLLDTGAAAPAFAEGDTAAADDVVLTTTAVELLCTGQDRVLRDPALWSKQILDALTAASGTTTGWAPFAAAAAQTAAGPGAPVLLLDHAGRPRLGGAVDVTVGPTTARATLVAADRGDLQRAVARLHAADAAAMPLANLFGAGSPVTLRPVTGTGDVQLARLEDATSAAGTLAVTPAARHVTFTDLHQWFAPQFATPATPLARYTRGNAMTPLVNGPEFFGDLFHRLQDARGAGAAGGFHLTGWSMFVDDPLTARLAGDPADFPTTLGEAATLIGQAGGGTRFLPAQFFQLDPSSALTPAEILAFAVIVQGLLLAKDVDAVRTDAAGAVILAALTIVNAIVISHIIDAGGRPIEPNLDAVDLLDAIAGAESRFSPFPATIADNPLAPPLTHFPWTTLFTLVRHVGIYHQKFGVVRVGSARTGYCGGIDLNPDRLDDERHLLKSPYHDVHARIEGPAVRDLELSFQERWTRDGGGTALAFDPEPATARGTPGSDVVQVARTYFEAAATTRALAFAPQGDRTIADTMLAAIESASDLIYIEDQYATPPTAYRDALIAKVTGREIRTLVLAMPGVADQPFGEIARSGFISDLRLADAGAGIVRIGYPRRHYTVPENDLRASSGRLRLMAALGSSGGLEPTVWLGPPSRVPEVPFWFAVDGELMYAYNEAISIGGTPPADRQGFAVVRGPDTRLVKGGPVATAVGARARAHAAGAAATVVDLAGIYVHAKMMIVDDVFVGIGSANLNRRGLFHDGEINVFSVPQTLRTSRSNPVAALRRRLWAEMLNLPLSTVGPLLQDPHAAARLFDRSPLLGNRYVDIEAFPTHLMYDATSGDGLVGAVLGMAVGALVAVDHAKLFDGVVDPTSSVESA